MYRICFQHIKGAFTILAFGILVMLVMGIARPVAAQPSFWIDPRGNFGQAAHWVCPEDPLCRDAENNILWNDWCGEFWVEVDDPKTPQTPDYWQDGCTFRWPDEDALNYELREFRVTTDDLVTFGGPAIDPDTGTEIIVTKTIVVPSLLVNADFDTEFVYGYAADNRPVRVEVQTADNGGTWCNNQIFVDPSPEGTWSADFAGFPCDADIYYPQVNLALDTWMAVCQTDDDGDSADLHWWTTAARSVRCVGFQQPLATYPITVKGKRTLPLRAKLYDAAGGEVTGSDVAAPPILIVTYEPGTPDEQNVTQHALPAGLGKNGNQFVYTKNGMWAFNLKTHKFSVPGTYWVTMESSNQKDYIIYRYSTCLTQFVIN